MGLRKQRSRWRETGGNKEETGPMTLMTQSWLRDASSTRHGDVHGEGIAQLIPVPCDWLCGLWSSRSCARSLNSTYVTDTIQASSRSPEWYMRVSRFSPRLSKQWKAHSQVSCLHQDGQKRIELVQSAVNCLKMNWPMYCSLSLVYCLEYPKDHLSFYKM